MGSSSYSKRVTLAAVARQAGVAESTASRVMNGYTRNFRVRPEVRQRVIDAARELNYKPNPMVRSIAAKQTNLVAIMGSTRDEEMYTAVHAAARVLIEEGKHVCTSFLDPDDGAFGAPSWRVDGAIAVRPDDLQELESLRAQGVPCVSIDGMSPSGSDSACIDEDASVRLAFEHLKQGGHDSIAYVRLRAESKPATTKRTIETRDKAYQTLCKKHGVSPDTHDVDNTPGGAAKAIGKLVSSEGVGVIASDATTAMRLLQGAAELGVRTPDDLSLVCLGDTSLARLATPMLTCVRQSLEEIGRAAAHLLLKRLDMNPDSPAADVPEAKRQLFAGKIIERGSTPAMQIG